MSLFVCLAIMLAATLTTIIAIPILIFLSKGKFDKQFSEAAKYDQMLAKTRKCRLARYTMSDVEYDFSEVPLELAPQRFSVLG